jgi:hypothetical protein
MAPVLASIGLPINRHLLGVDTIRTFRDGERHDRWRQPSSSVAAQQSSRRRRIAGLNLTG